MLKERALRRAAVLRQISVMRQQMAENDRRDIIERERHSLIEMYARFSDAHYTYDKTIPDADEEEVDESERYYDEVFRPFIELLESVKEYVPSEPTIQPEMKPIVPAVPSINPSNATTETDTTNCPPATSEVASPNNPDIVASPEDPSSSKSVTSASSRPNELGCETQVSCDDPVARGNARRPDVATRGKLRLGSSGNINGTRTRSALRDAGVLVLRHATYKSDRHYWRVHDDPREIGTPQEKRWTLIRYGQM